MCGYNKFAWFYDRLTENVDYNLIGRRIDELVKRYGGRKDILLELGCGSGSVCEVMCGLGYDVIGVDTSQEMLNQALDKKYESKSNIQYLCQDMRELDMYGTIDVTISVLDSINHLPDAESVKKTFERVSLFAYPDGLFIFDVNTRYKHKEILGNNSYIYDLDGLFCAWQNEYDERDGSVEINLDFFEEDEKGIYRRYQEEFREIALEEKEIDRMLLDCGFEILGKFDGYTDKAVSEETQRIVYVAKKKF
ncbi:MAG: class I SAM-dependent DNA methyltransferase [Oscillospiraceae bacterium]